MKIKRSRKKREKVQGQRQNHVGWGQDGTALIILAEELKKWEYTGVGAVEFMSRTDREGVEGKKQGMPKDILYTQI